MVVKIILYILQVLPYDGIDDEIAYFTVRWKTRASFVYRTVYRHIYVH